MPAEMAEDFLPTEQSASSAGEKKSVSKSRRAVAHR
jgi:hypothetical protein